MQNATTSIEFSEEELKRYISGTRLTGDIGYLTGFESFDTLVGKTLPGDFILIAARPSMGKTSFAINLAVDMAERYNIKVVIYSLEANKFQISTKLLSGKCGLTKENMQINDEWVPEAQAAVRWLMNLINSKLLIIYDKIPSSQEEFLEEYEKFLKEDAKLLFTDHLGEIPLDPRVSNRTHALGDLARKIKNTTKKYGASAFVLHQLNRKLEERQNKRPVLSDLRDSGELEQIADKIWGLYRESYYSKNAPKDEAELLSLKGKDNATGSVTFSFNGSITTFTEKPKPKKKRRNLPAVNITPL